MKLYIPVLNNEDVITMYKNSFGKIYAYTSKKELLRDDFPEPCNDYLVVFADTKDTIEKYSLR